MTHSPPAESEGTAPADPSFVGREGELASLAADLAAAAAGHGGLVLLAGPPGIGKTRTFEEFARRAPLARDRILWGRCIEDSGAPAYWPWVQTIRSHIETRDDDELRATVAEIGGEIARLVPSLRERVGEIAPGPNLGPEQARFRLFDGVTVFFRRAATKAPLLVLIDDLQFADEGSLKLLAFLAQEIRHSRVLVVAACREPLSGERTALLEATRSGRRLPLRGLDLRDVERLLERRPTSLPMRIAAELHRATEGNPFFIEEMLRSIDEDAREGRRPEPRAEPALPAEVRELLVRHLAPLSPDERRLLATAAILGREFDLLSLEAACALSADRVLDRLDAAIREGLVEEVPVRLGRFRFRHPLIREALYTDLGPAERAALHLSVARALERQHEGSSDPPLDELAFHFHAGAPLGDADKAIDYSVRAAQRAGMRLAYEDAVKHYQRAHDALALHPVEPPRHVELLLGLAEAVFQTGDHAHARGIYERAARGARPLGDPFLFGLAALGFGRATPDDGAVHPESVALLEEALDVLPTTDSPLRIFLLARLALAIYFTRDRARIEDLSRQAVESARRLGDPRALTSAILGRHLVLLGPDGTPAERLTVLDEALRLARETENLDLAPAIQAWQVVALLEMGDGPAARVEVASFRRRWEESRLPVAMWHARALAATAALIDGRLAETARLAAEALARRSLGLISAPAQFYATQHFEVFRFEDRLGELEETIRALVRGFPASASWRCLLAELLAETGREREARSLVENLTAEGLPEVPRDGNYFPIVAALAEIAALLPEPRWAGPLYAGLAPFADRNVVMIYGSGFRGPVARSLGLLAELDGRPDDAEGHFEAALAMTRTMGARAWAAQTRCDLARLLLARGASADRERAARLVDEARRSADELAMPRVARTADRLAAALAGAGGTLAEAGRPGPARAAAEPAPTAMLRRDRDAWTVGYQGGTWRLADMKGLAYLGRLLANPDVEISALELVGAVPGAGAEGPQALERARVNATRAISAAVKRIAGVSPVLGRHLGSAVKTGIACSYRADPDRPIDWAL